MRLLIDTNVILDCLFQREPFKDDAAEILRLSAEDDIELFVSASAVTDIFYIARKELKDAQKARDTMVALMGVVGIAAVSAPEISNALSLAWKDFEDSVQYSVALIQGMDMIITRNGKDFENPQVKVMEPKAALFALKSKTE